jgi:hypothetical protein
MERVFLPDVARLERLPRRRAPMLFYMLRCAEGADEAFTAAVRGAGGELPWRAEVEYSFIGRDPDHWTHAAIVRFPDKATLSAASVAVPTVAGLEDSQAHWLRDRMPPFFLRGVAALLRAVGVFVAPKMETLEVFRSPEKREEALEDTIMGEFGGINPTRAEIERHLNNMRDSPAYMINFLKHRERAVYDAPVRNPDVSGTVAYNRRYGTVAIRSVMMLGGVLVYAGRTGSMVVEPNTETAAGGEWDSIAVLRYPRPISLFMLEYLPGYRAAVEHRRAGLERTALYISGEPES